MEDLREEVVAYNRQQLEHIGLVQEVTVDLATKLLNSVLRHDSSKFDKEEYWTFVDSRNSLNASKDGKDLQYQKFLNSEAIQRHITSSPHHPEYWDTRSEEMPIEYVIQMFFDWYSRSKQRKTNMRDFWEFNISKLIKQPKALALVTALRGYYGSED